MTYQGVEALNLHIHALTIVYMDDADSTRRCWQQAQAQLHAAVSELGRAVAVKSPPEEVDRVSALARVKQAQAENLLRHYLATLRASNTGGIATVRHTPGRSQAGSSGVLENLR